MKTEWRCKHAILVLTRLQREEPKFEASLGYVANSRPVWATCQAFVRKKGREGREGGGRERKEKREKERERNAEKTQPNVVGCF
jgi:hypothetical protein